MFTIETDFDETFITIMDGTGELDDVNVIMYDDYVHMRQWNEKRQFYDVVTMKPAMYLKLMKSWQLPDGTYQLHIEDDDGKND